MDSNVFKGETSGFSYAQGSHPCLSEQHPDDSQHRGVLALGAEVFERPPAKPVLHAEMDFS